MSRSYKKNWGYCDSNPWAKRQANKKVRRAKVVPNGGGYKKLYCSWNIHDWKYLVWGSEDLSSYWDAHPYRLYTK